MYRRQQPLELRELVGPALIAMLAAGVIATFVTAFALTAGGGEEVGEVAPTVTETPVGPPAAEFGIAAIPVIKFDTEDLTIPAGQTVSVLMDNVDTGIPHNLAVYADEGFKQVVVRGRICTAPCQDTVTVGPLEPGEYYFQCDVHPIPDMRGTLTVE